jgi:hypothetical protein
LLGAHRSGARDRLEWGMIAGMTTPNAELSSLATALDELTKRLGAMAEAAQATKDDDTSTELFAVERALRGAHRRLQKLTTPRDRLR